MGKDEGSDATTTTTTAATTSSSSSAQSSRVAPKRGGLFTLTALGSEARREESLLERAAATQHNRILVEATAATARLLLSSVDTGVTLQPSALLQLAPINLENRLLKEYEQNKARKSKTSIDDLTNKILLCHTGHGSKNTDAATFPSAALSFTKQEAPDSTGTQLLLLLPPRVPQEDIAQNDDQNTDSSSSSSLAGGAWAEQRFVPSLDDWGEDDAPEERAPGVDEWAPLLAPAQAVDSTLPQKKSLLALVSTSLMGELDHRLSESTTCARLLSIMEELAQTDPEFILKVAVYSRRELGIRKTSNILLALAAHLPPCRPHLLRYFSAAVVLPSDWLNVASIYKCAFCSERSLPSCLRRALSEKFPEFSEYHLAKYNKVGGRKKIRSTEEMTPTGYSLKFLIRYLHISKPVYSVMSLIGKRYPSDLATFARSGLPGAFDSRRAGTRMKLAIPETWETQVSLRGNRAEVWEQLIDHKQLPFMAMLRNLRNMICAGISPAHHAAILHTLTAKDSVVRSKQFPFRFFSAYEVLSELEAQLAKKEEEVPSLREMLRGAIMKKLRGKLRIKGNISASMLRKKFDADLYRMCAKNRKRLLDKITLPAGYDSELLGRYKAALDCAVKISTAHNVAPLPGRTLILCDASSVMDQNAGSGSGLGRSRSVMEVALLLGLMVKFASEHAELVLWSQGSARHVQLAEGTILENVEWLLQQRKEEQKRKEELNENENSENNSAHDFLEELLSSLLLQKQQVTALVMLDWRIAAPKSVQCFLARYRRSVNPRLLFLFCNLTTRGMWRGAHGARSCSVVEPSEGNHDNDVHVWGYSDQILRFLSEHGGGRMLQHVERMDVLYDVPPPPEAIIAREESLVAPAETPMPLPPSIRWRSVRVFISSTFRDMHGERDLLCRVVLPELRARAAALLLHIIEVDLRWGITEEEARHNRQLELCLAEVHRCDYFLGMLGQRYGTVLQEYLLPDEPHFQWVAAYPRGRSVTELEITQCALRDGAEHRAGRAFFYFRDSSFFSSVPTEWVADFSAESDEAMMCQDNLKQRIVASGLPVMKQYPCVWGGVAAGVPGVAGLEEFGKAVLRDLWTAISQEATKTGDADGTGGSSEHERQTAFATMQAGRASARRDLLQEAAGRLRATEDGGAVLVRGASASGKTVLMAQLAERLAHGWTSEEAHGANAPSAVLPFFSDACSERPSLSRALSYLCAGLQAKLGLPASIPASHQALASLLKSLLKQAGGVKEEEALASVTVTGTRRKRQDGTGKVAAKRCRERGPVITILVDGLDGELCSSVDWLPNPLPPGVRLVVSATLGSSLDKALLRVCSVNQVCVGALERKEKADVVRRLLTSHHKKLDESHWNNQMTLLLAKRESRCPLFLTIACRELRGFGQFSKVSERIKQMPHTVSGLLQEVLARLELDHGASAVRAALTLLSCSRTGFADEDLRQLVSLCLAAGLWGEQPTTPKRYTVAKSEQQPQALWDKLNGLPMSPRNSLPMARFSHLTRELKSFVGGSCSGGGERSATERLQLSQELVLAAVHSRYLRPGDTESLAHMAIAVHLHKKLRPWQEGRSSCVDPDVLAELPYHLVHAGLAVKLGHLLSDLRFLYLRITSRFIPQLLEDFDLYATSLAQQGLDPAADVDELRQFVSRSQHILSRSPRLLWQQAINTAPGSSASVQATALVKKASRAKRATSASPAYIIEWLNRLHTAPAALRTARGFVGEPTCVATRGDSAVVATGQGHVQLLHLDTGKELRSVSAHNEGISACCFLSENLICLGTTAGQVSTWNIRDGYRVVGVQAHRLRVSGCAPSPCGRQLLTVSWDCSLKIWSVNSGHCIAERSSERPLSCVAIDPRGALVVTGGWDTCLVIWDIFHLKRVSTLRGHRAAIRSVAYGPSGKNLASAALDGEVKLWSSASGTMLGTYLGHQGPVNCVQFTPDGHYLLTGGDDNKVRVWTGGLGRPVATLGTAGRGSAALCVAGNPDGSLLAVGLHCGSLRVHNIHTRVTVEVQAHTHAVHCVVWLLGARSTALVSSSESGSIKVWSLTAASQPSGTTDAPDGTGLELSQTLQGPTGTVRALACSSSWLAAASDDATVTVWPIYRASEAPCVAGSTPGRVLRGHDGAVTCCCFNPDGSQLLTGGKDRSLVFWDVGASRPWRHIPSSHSDWVTGVHWDHSGHAVVSCSNDCTVKVWDCSSGLLQWELRGHQSAVNCVSIVDGVIMSGSYDGELRVWSSSGQEMACIPAHAKRINGTWAWLQEGAAGLGIREADGTLSTNSTALRVASASDDGSVRIWAPLMGSELTSLSGHSGPVQALAMTPLTSGVLSASADGSVKMWSLRIPSVAASVQACPHQRAVTVVQPSPSRRRVVSGAEDGLIVVWGPELVPSTSAQAHGGAVSCVCFPELTDNVFLTAGLDRQVCCWKILPGDPVEVCRLHRLEVEAPLVSMAAAWGSGSSAVLAGDTAARVLLLCPRPLSVTTTWSASSEQWIVGIAPSARDLWQVCGVAGPKEFNFSTLRVGQNSVECLESCTSPLADGPHDAWLTHAGALQLEGGPHWAWGNSRGEVTLSPVGLVAHDGRVDAGIVDASHHTWQVVHGNDVTGVTVMGSVLATASLDHSVKLWSLPDLCQVGVFVCGGPVTCMKTMVCGDREVVVCGDSLGQVYFLRLHDAFL